MRIYQSLGTRNGGEVVSATAIESLRPDQLGCDQKRPRREHPAAAVFLGRRSWPVGLQACRPPATPGALDHRRNAGRAMALRRFMAS